MVFSCSLYYFSDASDKGYGQAKYTRLVNTAGKVHCSLVIAKSQVAPIKYISIPRLELAAAVLSTKISRFIKKELRFDDTVKYYWTNNQVVIGYLRNTQKRFKVFVANWVLQIRESSDVLQWDYIPSKMNPANYTSQGWTWSSKEQVHVWFISPEFLWKSELQWPKQKSKQEIQDDDPRFRAEVKVHGTALHESIIEKLKSSISGWTIMKRVVA